MKLVIVLLIGLLIGTLLGGVLVPAIMALAPIPVATYDYSGDIYNLLKKIQTSVGNIEWNTYQIMNQ